MVAVQFPRHLDRRQERLRSSFGAERQFQKGRQITTQPCITGAQFILEAMIFETLKLTAVVERATQSGFVDLSIKCD